MWAWGAGLSLGEYCALVFAGVLSFEDGLRVVKARADSMAAAATLGEPSAPPPTCHAAHAGHLTLCTHQLFMLSVMCVLFAQQEQGMECQDPQAF